MLFIFELMENLKLTNFFELNHLQLLAKVRFVAVNTFDDVIYIINDCNQIVSLDVSNNKVRQNIKIIF